MRRSSILAKLPVLFAAASVAFALSCKGRGSGTGQPYYGPGTGPIASFIPGGLGSLKTTEYLYWVNSITNDIAIYAVDSTSGSLAPITSNNISTGNSPISIQGYPDLTKRLMYVGCVGSGDILPYFIDPNGNGNLTPSATSFNVGNLGKFAQMRFRGDGAFLYILTNVVTTPGPPALSTGVLSAFVVNTTSGALTPPANVAGKTIQSTIQVATPAPGLFATAFAIDQNNKFAYVTLSDNRIVCLSLDNSGSLSVVQQQPSGQNFVNAVASPSCIISYQTYLYEGSLISSNLDFLSTASGQMTLNNNTFATGGQQPVAVVIPITGGFLFTANFQSGDVSEFTLASANGVLGPQPLPPPTVGGTINPMTGQPGKSNTLWAIAINFTGKFAYTLDNGVPPPQVVPAQISCWSIQGGLFVPAKQPQPPPTGPAGPTGQPFTNIQIQKQGVWGTQPPQLAPDSIIVFHTN